MAMRRFVIACSNARGQDWPRSKQLALTMSEKTGPVSQHILLDCPRPRVSAVNSPYRDPSVAP